MKKILLILLILALLIVPAGCKKTNSQEVVGIIREYNEGCCMLVDVVGGHQEDVMEISLIEKFKIEKDVDENITEGNAIGFIITGDVAESYPVQVRGVKVLWNEPVITGIILSAGEESILLQVESGIDSKLVQAHITEDTVFYRNIPTLTEKGKLIGFTTTGEILESDPPQVYVKRFVIYE